MAVPTAIAFFLLSTAILLYRSEFGIFRFLLTPYDGSRMARFLVPCALSLPVITGLINEYGETKGWFSSSSSVALFTIVHVLLFVLLVWYSTKSINKSAAELAEQRQRTKELDEQLAIKQAKEFERKLLENRLRQQNELIQATIEAEEKERKQIGMELHDHINQILASTKLYLELAKMDDSLRDDILEKCTLQLNFAISEIRNLSRSLVLHETETGDILGNLFESINHIENSAGIRIESNICDASMNLLCQKEKVAIYRIIQEQLSNIVKHAAATNVNIRFCSEGDYIKLVISDNGKGFDIKKQPRGIGLSNINSRVTSLNGELKIISSAGNGCELSIVLPR
jgi:signal transduction histidine kinase